jgi:hypothetical protein
MKEGEGIVWKMCANTLGGRREICDWILTQESRELADTKFRWHRISEVLCATDITFCSLKKQWKTLFCPILHDSWRRNYFHICAVLGSYAASSGNLLPTFRDNASMPSWLLKMGQIYCPEMSVKHYNSTLRKNPEERWSHQHRGVSLKSRTAVLFQGF